MLCADEKTEMVDNLVWGDVSNYKCVEKQFQSNGYVEEFYGEQ